MALVSKSLWFRFPYPCEYFCFRLSRSPQPYFHTFYIIWKSYVCSMRCFIFQFVIFQSSGVSLLFLLLESLVTIIYAYQTIICFSNWITWMNPTYVKKRNGGWSTCFSNWITWINAIYFFNKRNGCWSTCFCNWKRGGLLCLRQASRSSFLQTSSSCHFSFPHNHDEQHDGDHHDQHHDNRGDIHHIVIVMIIIAQALPLRHLMQSTGALALRALAAFSQVTLSTECFLTGTPLKSMENLG